MASGVQNQIGIGQAQVLDSGPSHFPLAQQLYRQKLTKEESDRRNQLLRKEEEQNLYGLIGDALKLKDFNPVVHDKVRQAQSDLAKKIKLENPSYADTYLAAQNAAGELTQMSQGFNQLDQIIAATKKEYEQDKRINAANIEGIARKMALDDFNKTGRVDPSKNYFDEALNQFPEFALTDKSDYTTTRFLPEEKQDREGKFTEINAAGRKDMFKWKANNYPIYYDFKDNGEEKAPTITTRSQGEYEGMPMLSEEAYGRFKATPSNVVAVNRRIKSQYPDINLGSEEAEKLRRVEAYKDIDRQKPPVNKERLDQAAPTRSHSFYFGSGFGQGGAAGQTQGNAIDGILRNIKHLQVKDGRIYDKEGKDLFKGNWTISSNDVPADLYAILDIGGYDLRGVKDFEAEIHNGDIVGLTPLQGLLKGKKIDRKAVERSQHKYYNPGKGEPYVEFEKPNAKTYSLNGKSYSQAQVDAAARKSGISTEAYIKKYGLK